MLKGTMGSQLTAWAHSLHQHMKPKGYKQHLHWQSHSWAKVEQTLTPKRKQELDTGKKKEVQKYSIPWVLLCNLNLNEDQSCSTLSAAWQGKDCFKLKPTAGNKMRNKSANKTDQSAVSFSLLRESQDQLTSCSSNDCLTWTLPPP